MYSSEVASSYKGRLSVVRIRVGKPPLKALKDYLRFGEVAARRADEGVPSPLTGLNRYVSFIRGNVSFVPVVTFRARLFLFPVPC